MPQACMDHPSRLVVVPTLAHGELKYHEACTSNSYLGGTWDCFLGTSAEHLRYVEAMAISGRSVPGRRATMPGNVQRAGALCRLPGQSHLHQVQERYRTALHL